MTDILSKNLEFFYSRIGPGFRMVLAMTGDYNIADLRMSNGSIIHGTHCYLQNHISSPLSKNKKQ